MPWSHNAFDPYTLISYAQNSRYSFFFVQVELVIIIHLCTIL